MPDRDDPDETSNHDRRPLRIGIVTDCYVPHIGGIEMQVHDLGPQPSGRRPRSGGGHADGGSGTVDGVRVRRRRAAPALRRALPAVDVPPVGRPVDRGAGRRRALPRRAGVTTGVPRRQGPRSRTPDRDHRRTVCGAMPRRFPVSPPRQVVHWPVVLSAVSEVAAAPMTHSRTRSARLGAPERRRRRVVRRSYRSSRITSAHVTLISVMRLAPRKRPLQC